MDEAFNAALRFLSYRPRSEQEVRGCLSKRFCPTAVEGALEALKDRGLLDDMVFATFWRRSREQSRPRGASAIRWELLRRGVSREVAEEALWGLDEEEGAYQAGKRVVRRLCEADYATFRKVLGAHLGRRSFRRGAIDAAVKRLWNELSDPVYGYEEGGDQYEQP